MEIPCRCAGWRTGEGWYVSLKLTLLTRIGQRWRREGTDWGRRKLWRELGKVEHFFKKLQKSPDLLLSRPLTHFRLRSGGNHCEQGFDNGVQWWMIVTAMYACGSLCCLEMEGAHSFFHSNISYLFLQSSSLFTLISSVNISKSTENHNRQKFL